MKKSVLLFVAIIAMCLPANALTTTAVLLNHNGKITIYEADDIQNALDDAVDGDVIYLNEGRYPGFIIKNKISVKGVGEKTEIDGSIGINLPIVPGLDRIVLSEPMLEFLNVWKNITISKDSSPLERLVIKQCQCKSIYFRTYIYDSYIDRCNINGSKNITGEYGLDIEEENLTYIDGIAHHDYYVKGLTVTNSLIYDLVSSLTPVNVSFLNCQINYIRYGSAGIVRNSIVNYQTTYGTGVNYTLFINSYIDSRVSMTDDYPCELRNCYRDKKYLSYTSEDIASLGYLGDDDTIIGPLGGNTPYTLIPAIPKVTDGKLSVDPQKQQLNVTLTVSPK